MREKTLLYGALAATALAATAAVYQARESTREGRVMIAPVLRLDAPRSTRAAAPIRLTASDGTGLRLLSLEASGAIHDPVALTQLHLVFENPEDRVLEGTFSILLPREASVSRFAMKGEDGTWREGEVVERQHARAAYEDLLHRKEDPALLEQSAGNEFGARVFPIAAHEKKEIILTYSQVLEGGTSYVIPLAGLPALAALDVDVRAASAGLRDLKFGVHEHDNPAEPQDVVVEARSLPRSGGLRSTDADRKREKVIARVVPFGTSRPAPLESAVILVDTSASRTLGLTDQARLVERVIAKLRPTAFVSVATFDQDVVPIYAGPASGYGPRATDAILERGALGASDVEQALAWAAAEAQTKRAKRVVLVGDGVTTAGKTTGLGMETLRASHVERIDAIAIGGLRDDRFLRSLVRGALDRDGAVLDADLGADGLARRLEEATSSGIPVTVEGASWSWPRTLDGLQAGDEVMVYAEIPADMPVRIDVGGQRFTPDVVTGERPLVERTWAHGKIQGLLEAPTDAPEITRRQIVELGTRHRIVSPFTAMLVLDNDADYARYGIERAANQNILVVEQGRVTVAGRAEPPPPKVVTAPTTAASASAAPVEPSKPRETQRDERPSDLGKNEAEKHGAQAPHDEGQTEGRKEKPKESAASHATTTTKTPAAKAPSPPAPPALHRPLSSPTPRPAASSRTFDRSDPWGGKDDGAEISRRRAPPPPSEVAPPYAPEPSAPAARSADDGEGEGEELPVATPYEGRFAVVMSLLARGDKTGALAEARAWHDEAPGDAMALVALGEALEAKGDLRGAARAYGSLLDLFPSRADFRRFVGERLERLRDPAALRLAVDTYAKAVLARPDHPSSHRLYAFALLRSAEHERAFEALRAGATRAYPEGRFAEVSRVFREDLGLIAAAWMRVAPARKTEIEQRLRAAGGVVENKPSLRFVLVWETDTNDVDLHVRDAHGRHAYYARRALGSGGELYADVTTGYGPECFTVRRPPGARAAPYKLWAHYYARGPMGYGMGKVEVIEHDGMGNLAFDERPFVVMTDDAWVELGPVSRVSVDAKVAARVGP